MDASRGWVLTDEPSLGASLAWADRRRVEELHLIVDGSANDAAASTLARQAGEFRPAPAIWSVADRAVRPVDPAPPMDPAGSADLPDGAATWARLLIDHGVEPVVEHGILRGDVLGLEVARLVEDGSGGWRLEIGVGVHDREARREMVPDEDPGRALDQVVEVVRTWRSPEARLHPANTLAPERWLRSVLVSHPAVIGVADLAPVAPPTPRGDLRRRCPAPAVGTDGSGEPVVVVCSTGIDLDLVPAAGDSRRLDGRDARLVVVVPEGDDHPVTRALAARLDRPAEVRTVTRDWPALTWASAG